MMLRLIWSSRCWFCLLFLFLTQAADGQYLVRPLGEDVLLSPERIAFITKSTKGLYYLGNTTGLSVFDGKTSKQLTIRDRTTAYVHDQMVQSKMYEDEEGLLWFSTYTALHSYNPSDHLFRTFRIERDGNMVQQSYHVFHYGQQTGELWLKAGDQLWSFNTKTHQSRRIAGPTIGNRFIVTETKEKRQIISCPFLNGEGIEVFTPAEGGVASPRKIDIAEKITSAIAISDSSFLLGMNTGLGELTLSDTAHNFRRITSNDRSHSVWSFCRPPGSNKIWMSYNGFGVYAYDPQQKMFVDSIRREDGLSSNTPKEIFADGPGRLLVSQYSTGLDIVERSNNCLNDTHPLADKRVFSFVTSHNKGLLAAGLQSLYHSRSTATGNQWEEVEPARNASNPPYNGRFFAANNQLFLQGLTELWAYDTKKARWRSYPKPEYPVRGIFIAPDASFLMLSERGVQICQLRDDKILTEPSTLFSPNNTNEFLGLFQLTDSTFLLPWQSSEVWLGAYDEQGYHLRQRIPLPGEVQAVLQDPESGIIYVGGTAGLHLIQDNQARAIPLVNAENETPIVEALVKDRKGLLWAGTRNGLYQYNEADSSSIWFSTADGLPANRFIDDPAILLPSDSILMGTRAGLFTFSPACLKPDTEKLTPYISGLRINDLDVSQDSTIDFSKEKLSLPYRKNKLDFQVANIGLHQSGISSVKYQLIGFEPKPTIIAAHNTIRYPNLPPGSYTLHLTAINRNGLPAGTYRLAVIIDPPFTQTLTFYLLCTGALALLIAIFYIAGLRRERLKQLRLRKQQEQLASERDRIAGEVHDDLGGQISSILYLSEEMLLTGTAPDNEYELNRINELSRNSLQNVRDIIFALDNRRATLSALGEQLRGAGETFFGDRKIDFQSTEHYDSPAFELTSRQKRNLTLIVKEAWHNIAKSAKASLVNLDLKEANRTLTITVTDNGVGFDQAASVHGMGGYGLDNMQEKAQAIGGQLIIDSVIGKGTTVQVSWPLPIIDK